MSQLAAPITKDGVVLSQPMYDAVDRISPNGFLHVHGRQIAEEHGSRPQVRFPAGEHRELEGKASRFVDPPLYVFRYLSKVVVARRQL